MLKQYVNHQSGVGKSINFRNYIQTERINNLSLSKLCDIDNIFPSGVNTLNIDPEENRYLLSGCADGSIFIHDLYNFTGKERFTSQCVSRRHRAHLASIESATWIGPGNGLFVSSGTDGFLKVWDTNTFTPSEIFPLSGKIFHHSPGVVPGWEGTLSAGRSSGLVNLVDLRVGCSIRELRGHSGPVLATAWSPRIGPLLATSGSDGRVIMWDIRSAGSVNHCLNLSDSSKCAHFGIVNGLVFTNDGLHIVSFGSDNVLRLFNVEQGTSSRIHYGSIKNSIRRHVQLAISNNTIFVPSQGSIVAVDLFRREWLHQLNGHFNRVNCCTLREPFNDLYSGSHDRNIIVWSADRHPNDNDFKVESNEADHWSSNEDNSG